MNNIIKERISHVVIKLLLSRFKSFPEDSMSNRNAPFHTAFLVAFSDKINNKDLDLPYFITMSSWLHGLSTSLGQTFFESAAQILCDGEKREYTAGKGKLGLLEITKKQENEVSSIMADLYNGKHSPDVKREENLLYTLLDGELVEASGFSADVYYECGDDIVAIELKSVKPNSGEMKGEKKKILEAKCALKRLHPDKNIKFYIGFPFDPTGEGVSFDKERFVGSVINLGKSFAHDEMLLSEELWDFLSGEQGTMQGLLDIINSIATPDFLRKYSVLNDLNKRQMPEYKSILKEWNLFDELLFVENIDCIIEKSKENKDLAKLLNKLLFDKDGKYNQNRVNDILKHSKFN